MPGHQLLAVINSYMVEHFDEITAGDSSPCKGKMRKEISEFSSLTSDQQQYILSHVSDTPGRRMNSCWYLFGTLFTSAEGITSTCPHEREWHARAARDRI